MYKRQVLELNELVKACEEEFGVSAAAGVVVAAAAEGCLLYTSKLCIANLMCNICCNSGGLCLGGGPGGGTFM